MAISTNLGFTLVEVSQEDKEGAINNAINGLDTSLSGRLVHDMTSDANYTIDTGVDEHYNLIIEITDTGNLLTTTRNIIFPNITQAHIFKNSTAQSLVAKTVGGSGVTVSTGDIALIYSNGTNIEYISSASTSTGSPYYLHFFYPGLSSNNDILSFIVFMNTVEYTAGLAGSYVKALIAATGTVTYSMRKNDIQFGTFTFSAGSAIGSFTMASDTLFNAGDTLKVVAPASADATLAGISLNLKGTKF